MRLPIRIAHGSLYAGFIMPPPGGRIMCWTPCVRPSAVTYLRFFRNTKAEETSKFVAT